MSDEKYQEKIPAPPHNVDHRDLWYEVGTVNAKMDVLLEQMPDLHKRVRSLEKTRTQAATIAGLFTTGVVGTVAAYSKKLLETINGI